MGSYSVFYPESITTFSFSKNKLSMMISRDRVNQIIRAEAVKTPLTGLDTLQYRLQQIVLSLLEGKDEIIQEQQANMLCTH